MLEELEGFVYFAKMSPLLSMWSHFLKIIYVKMLCVGMG